MKSSVVYRCSKVVNRLREYKTVGGNNILEENNETTAIEVQQEHATVQHKRETIMAFLLQE